MRLKESPDVFGELITQDVGTCIAFLMEILLLFYTLSLFSLFGFIFFPFY